jgi:hypothetical protein
MATETTLKKGSLEDLALGLNPDQSGGVHLVATGTAHGQSEAPSHGSEDRRRLARGRCRELVHGGMTSGADIGRVLAGEDLSHPQPTVNAWVRADRATMPPPSIGAVADRVLRLASSELGRLEQQHPSKLDLERVGKVAQILKTLQGLGTGKRGSEPTRTLQDLSSEEPA